MKQLGLTILGILAILYGITILQLNSGTSFWMIWELIGLLFIIWAYLLYKHITIHRVIYIMITIGFTILLFLNGCILSHFNDQGQPNLDYIIVLGAQVKSNGPSAVLKYRLDYAIDYLNQNPDTKCIVSGGQGANEPFSEGQGMYDYLVKNNINPQRISIEDQSKNTVQNIQYSSKLLDKNASIGIVTNNFHTFRALRIAKKQGLNNVYGLASPSHNYYLPNNILRECMGIIKDFLYQNI